MPPPPFFQIGPIRGSRHSWTEAGRGTELVCALSSPVLRLRLCRFVRVETASTSPLPPSQCSHLQPVLGLKVDACYSRIETADGGGAMCCTEFTVLHLRLLCPFVTATTVSTLRHSSSDPGVPPTIIRWQWLRLGLNSRPRIFAFYSAHYSRIDIDGDG